MLSVGAAASCSSARLGGGRVAADGAATARTRLRRVAAAAWGPARRRGGRLASETPSKRSDSISTDRPGADRRRALNATAPSPPARVRVARARVLLSRPVCCLRLLASARARFLRTLGPHHTEPSFTQRRPPSSRRPAVRALPSPNKMPATLAGFLAGLLAQNLSRRPPGPPRAAQQPYTSSH